MHRHGGRLWAVALRTLGDREEAADAVQDALLAAYRGAPAFRGEAAVGTWLYRITVNACLDRLRRARVRPTVPLPEAAGDLGVADPADAFAAADLSLDVAAALHRLPVEQRLAVVLVDVQGLPVAEAAAVLQVPEGTVKSRCARGRVQLAGLLGPDRNRAAARRVGQVTATPPTAPAVPAPPAPAAGAADPRRPGRDLP